VYSETRQELEHPHSGHITQARITAGLVSSSLLLQATQLWRLYHLTLSSVVDPPYLGYCKLFQVSSDTLQH
jgi:hypothetical protein